MWRSWFCAGIIFTLTKDSLGLWHSWWRMIGETFKVWRSPRAPARTAGATVWATSSGAGAGDWPGVCGGGRHGGGEIRGLVTRGHRSVMMTSRTRPQHAASVYRGRGGVAPVKVSDGWGRPLWPHLTRTVTWQGVGGVGAGCRGRVEIVLRSDVGGAGARAAAVTCRQGRCHSWK